MRLVLNDATFAISQMGPDYLLLEAPVAQPPGRGRIELQVDDSRRTWEVDLPQGIRANGERVQIGTPTTA
ncbi:MAG: hypothetical protein FJ387_13230 [Verrucomicrobia bacterium]|nr:hypothetical protein [Verrucomicrobiota bacterium]